MTPESLRVLPQEFLGGSRHAVVLEDGARVFDRADAKYSISGEYDKCLLHLWSAERNAVRRILDAEIRNSNLRLTVQRMGQSRPSKLEISKGHDHRTPTARRVARATYQQRLGRSLERNFPDYTLTKLNNAMNLERSFGPIYARGLMRHGRSAFAVLGVNQEESQASIDAATHVCHPLARRLPRRRSPGGRGGSQNLSARGLIGAHARTPGAFEHGRREVAAV